jgi:hypothetical protein
MGSASGLISHISSLALWGSLFLDFDLELDVPTIRVLDVTNASVSSLMRPLDTKQSVKLALLDTVTDKFRHWASMSRERLMLA